MALMQEVNDTGIKPISQPKAASLLPRMKPGYRGALLQAIELQRVAHRAALTLAEDLENTKDKELRTRIASGLSSLLKGWDCIEDRKRILRGRPMPGSLRPEPKPKKPRRTRVSNEPVDPSMIDHKAVNIGDKHALKESLPAKPEESKATSEGNLGVP